MIIQVVRNVGQVRLFWLDSFDGGESLRDSKMSGMWLIAQCIDNQDIQSFQQWPAFVRDVTDIRTESDIADPKSEDWQSSMNQADGLNLLTKNFKGSREIR